MKLLKLIWLFFIGTAVIVLFDTCKHDNEDEAEIVCKLSEKQIGSFSATLVFTHNGTNRDRYYGFIVPSQHVDVFEQIANVVDSLSPRQLLSQSFEQRKREIRLSRLSAHTPYTYIVFGLDENGVYNGRRASIKFTTVPCDLKVSLNPAWKLTHKGETLHNNGYYTLINNEIVGFVQQRYIFVTYTKQQRESFGSEEEFIAYSVETYNQTLNEDHNPDFWLDGSEVFTTSMNFYRYLDPGDYVSYVIGIDVSGRPTGDYNKTAYYHVDEYPMLPAYSNLIGTWKFADNYGQSFQVTLSKKKVNQTFTMKGWSGLNTPVTVEFNQNTGKLYIEKQLLKSNMHVNYTDGTSANGDLYLRAWYQYEGLTIATVDGILAVGNKETNSRYKFTSNFNVYVLDGMVTCPMGLSFVLEQDDGRSVLLNNMKMQFPIYLKKI